jgi:hypothetical protein
MRGTRVAVNKGTVFRYGPKSVTHLKITEQISSISVIRSENERGQWNSGKDFSYFAINTTIRANSILQFRYFSNSRSSMMPASQPIMWCMHFWDKTAPFGLPGAAPIPGRTRQKNLLPVIGKRFFEEASDQPFTTAMTLLTD